MEYGWNVGREEVVTFSVLSRELYYANLLMDEIVLKNSREVRRLLRVHGARADVVVPERGAAALHLLAGLEAEHFAADVTLSVLRGARADPDVRSEEGLTPVHVAATYGRCRVLEVLLTNGANPSLIDYHLLLPAEEHAYKEQQWKAYTMLTTYSAILTSERRFSKYNDEFSSSKRSRSYLNTNSYEASMPNISVKNRKQKLDYGEENIIESRVCDELTYTQEKIELDENALNIVKNHSKDIETYQSPFDQEEKYSYSFDDKLPDVDGTKLAKNKFLTTKRYLEEKLPWSRSLKPQTAERRSSEQSRIDTEVNSSLSSLDLGPTTKPNLIHQSKNEHSMESVTDIPNLKSEESEMYIYGYAESSLKSRRSRKRTSVSSVCQKSDLHSSKGVNNAMLCKMSRIFLYILKKRHSSYRQLDA